MRTCIAERARVWGAVVCIGGSWIGSAGISLAESAHPASMPDIAGRWRSETKTLVLDIMRCGSKFCGQEVISSGCGKTVLELGNEETAGEMWRMEGTFDPPGATQRHEAIVHVYTIPAEGLFMGIQAYVEPPTIVHRTIPFEAEYKRIGPPTCRPAPTS